MQCFYCKYLKFNTEAKQKCFTKKDKEMYCIFSVPNSRQTHFKREVLSENLFSR